MAELLGQHAIDIAELTLVPSSGGVFEVEADGDVLFSKKQAGRHANEGEVLSAFRRKLA